MNTHQSITLLKLIELWQGLKTRRLALGMTQEQMAEALGISYSAYTHYEISGQKLTTDRLMKLDGAISMLEKSVGKPVDNSGIKKPARSASRLQELIPTVIPKIPTSTRKSKAQKV